jgi:hypothetical protein
MFLKIVKEKKRLSFAISHLPFASIKGTSQPTMLRFVALFYGCLVPNLPACRQAGRQIWAISSVG